jgi:hypothetical protein
MNCFKDGKNNASKRSPSTDHANWRRGKASTYTRPAGEE